MKQETSHAKSSIFPYTAGATVTLMPFTFGAARAGGHVPTDTFGDGAVGITPIDHASFLLDTGGVLIAVDPVGDATRYNDVDTPGRILIIHEHGDHFDLETITALTQNPDTKLIVNPAVMARLPEDLQARATALANGDDLFDAGIEFTAIPAYNTTEDRLNFHPQGRDNGYVLDIDRFPRLHFRRHRRYAQNACPSKHRSRVRVYEPALYNGRRSRGLSCGGICANICLSLPLPWARQWHTRPDGVCKYAPRRDRSKDGQLVRVI